MRRRTMRSRGEGAPASVGPSGVRLMRVVVPSLVPCLRTAGIGGGPAATRAAGAGAGGISTTMVFSGAGAARPRSREAMVSTRRRFSRAAFSRRSFRFSSSRRSFSRESSWASLPASRSWRCGQA